MEPNPLIDLRSDTVTRPTAGMRKAIAEAEVGDDVFGEDPTVTKLEERVAELLRKEAALFVPSGVMANQLAMKVLTQPGDEIIVERGSHIFNYETAAPLTAFECAASSRRGEAGIHSAVGHRSGNPPGRLLHAADVAGLR